MTLTDIRQSAGGIWAGINSLTESGALTRFRPIYFLMEGLLLLIAIAFWFSAYFDAGSAFSPETWGEWACQYPAQMWAFFTMSGATLTIVGLLHPQKCAVVAMGAAIQIVQFSALGWSAAFTGGQFVIMIYEAAFFVPIHLLILVGALRHGCK